MVQRNKKTSIHCYNEWKIHKVELRSSSSLMCAKLVFFSSSPACLSLKIRQKMFIYINPTSYSISRTKSEWDQDFWKKLPTRPPQAPTRAPASRRSPAGPQAGACNLSGMRVDFCSKSADFHARVSEVDSLHSHGFIMMKNIYQSKLYPEMQKHSKTRQKYTNTWFQDTNPSHYRTF